MIVEEWGELEEEARVLWSLVILARLKVRKANREAEEAVREREAMVELQASR